MQSMSGGGAVDPGELGLSSLDNSTEEVEDLSMSRQADYPGYMEDEGPEDLRLVTYQSGLI